MTVRAAVARNGAPTGAQASLAVAALLGVAACGADERSARADTDLGNYAIIGCFVGAGTKGAELGAPGTGLRPTDQEVRIWLFDSSGGDRLVRIVRTDDLVSVEGWELVTATEVGAEPKVAGSTWCSSIGWQVSCQATPVPLTEVGVGELLEEAGRLATLELDEHGGIQDGTMMVIEWNHRGVHHLSHANTEAIFDEAPAFRGLRVKLDELFPVP